MGVGSCDRRWSTFFVNIEGVPSIVDVDSPVLLLLPRYPRGGFWRWFFDDFAL